MKKRKRRSRKIKTIDARRVVVPKAFADEVDRLVSRIEKMAARSDEDLPAEEK